MSGRGDVGLYRFGEDVVDGRPASQDCLFKVLAASESKMFLKLEEAIRANAKWQELCGNSVGPGTSRNG